MGRIPVLEIDMLHEPTEKLHTGKLHGFGFVVPVILRLESDQYIVDLKDPVVVDRNLGCRIYAFYPYSLCCISGFIGSSL
nr:hypothetical protein [Rhodonellum psychrophilum]